MPGWLEILALVATAAACDIPTDAPIIQSQWFVPVSAESVAVAEVLPADVTVNGGVFEVSVPAAGSTASLEELCAACAALDGMVAPKPVFDGGVSASVALPGTVARATIGANTAVQIQIQHSLGFDPLRPSATARGTVTLTLRSGTTTLASDVIDGNVTALPPGTPLTRTITVPAGSVVDGGVTIAAAISSPAGDPVLIDADQSVTVTATPIAVTATSADVVIDGEDVSLEATELSVDDVDEDLIERLQGATVELAITNPMGVAGSFTLRFRRGGADVIAPKTITASGAASETVTAELTATEIRTLLTGTGTQLELEGTVSGTKPGRLATVTTTQVIRITPRLVLDTSVGD